MMNKKRKQPGGGFTWTSCSPNNDFYKASQPFRQLFGNQTRQ